MTKAAGRFRQPGEKPSRRPVERRHTREGFPHALHVSGAESGGDAVHPQAAGGDTPDLEAQILAARYLVDACERAIESLQASASADHPGRGLRPLITLRGIRADWIAALDANH